jgi:hypothetical protein
MSASEGRLFEVDVIVLDEVHYLSDISRGTVWEETVCDFKTLFVVSMSSHWSFDLPILTTSLGDILSKGSPAYMLVCHRRKS